jgi:hypothetical protein
VGPAVESANSKLEAILNGELDSEFSGLEWLDERQL